MRSLAGAQSSAVTISSAAPPVPLSLSHAWSALGSGAGSTSGRASRWGGTLATQLTAFFTSAPILAASAAVSSFSA